MINVHTRKIPGNNGNAISNNLSANRSYQAGRLSNQAVSKVGPPYHSGPSTQLKAHGHGQGINIHAAIRTERHLPVAPWHVAQQRKNRLMLPTQRKENLNSDDGKHIEQHVNDWRSVNLKFAGHLEKAKEQPGVRHPRAAGNTIKQFRLFNADGPRENNHGRSILQLKISYNAKKQEFITDGSRPGWRTHLKKSVADEYNDIFGTNLTARSRLPATDRAHRISFDAIQQLVCDFCNDPSILLELKELTDSLYTDQSSGEYRTMKSQRKDLIRSVGGNVNSTRAYANALLGSLNSATSNVGPGDASTNRGVGAAPDPGLTASPGGQHTILTPRSKRIFGAFAKYDRLEDFARTPGGSIRSSHHHSEYGTRKHKAWDSKKQRYHPYH